MQLVWWNIVRFESIWICIFLECSSSWMQVQGSLLVHKFLLHAHSIHGTHVIFTYTKNMIWLIFVGNCRVNRPVLWMLWDLWASEFCFRSTPLENTISGIRPVAAPWALENLRFFVASKTEPKKTDVPLFGGKLPETKFARHGKPEKW